MPRQVLNMTPHFTKDPVGRIGEEEEVKQSVPTQVSGLEGNEQTPTELPAEKETQISDDDSSSEETSPEQQEQPDTGDDKIQKQVSGLYEEREKLLREIQTLRGERRELKQKQIEKIEEKIEDELQDLNKDDVALVEKILKAKGYVTRKEASQLNYDTIKQQELDTFLSQYPEYKPENDPHDLNWNALQREMQLYRTPEDPYKIGQILRKSHLSIKQSFSSDRLSEAKKQRMAVAGSGASSGYKRSSSGKSLPEKYKEEYRRGGWSNEEISKIEQRL